MADSTLQADKLIHNTARTGRWPSLVGAAVGQTDSHHVEGALLSSTIEVQDRLPSLEVQVTRYLQKGRNT